MVCNGAKHTLATKHTLHTWCSQIHMPRMTLQTLQSTAFRLQTLHFTLQTPHLTLGMKRPALHFTFNRLNTTSENQHCKHYSPRHAHSTHQSPHSALQMQTRHSTCLPPHATQLFRQPTQSTHSRITHTEKKCKMAQGSKQVWVSRPRLKRNMPRLKKSRSRSKKVIQG